MIYLVFLNLLNKLHVSENFSKLGKNPKLLLDYFDQNAAINFLVFIKKLKIHINEFVNLIGDVKFRKEAASSLAFIFSKFDDEKATNFAKALKNFLFNKDSFLDKLQNKEKNIYLIL